MFCLHGEEAFLTDESDTHDHLHSAFGSGRGQRSYSEPQGLTLLILMKQKEVRLIGVHLRDMLHSVHGMVVNEILMCVSKDLDFCVVLGLVCLARDFVHDTARFAKPPGKEG